MSPKGSADGRYLLHFIAAAMALLACFREASAQTKSTEGPPAIRSIATIPAKLTQGSPFLLVVKLSGQATAVKGEWTSRHILFWKGRSEPGDGETWYALAGVDVEVPPGSSAIEIEATSLQGKALAASMPLEVSAAGYRTTTLKVAANFVEPDAATQQLIVADKALKDRIFAETAAEPQWSGKFIRPVRAASTDSFGTRRTFNGKLASIHRGMDFRAPSGTPVAAANSGKVVLARKLFYEGNCVVVDHGQGFMTLYMHLSRIDAVEGNNARKGQQIGLSGATGRVTGPHLHFAARWQGAYLDPAGLFQLGLTEMP